MFNPETDLWKLRMEIPLGSLFVRDYENSFCFTAESVCDFFDSFLSYIEEIAREENEDAEWDEIVDEYDNEETLLEWWGCYEWFPFEIDEDEMAYWEGEEAA